MDDSYLTIARDATAEIKIKGSRFIGEVSFGDTLEKVSATLANIQKKAHDATHHCYAYRVGIPAPTIFKYSDDGEPSGTAGKPIYDCIVGRELTNVLVVVTRYFGGTKLGTGGLVRAYSDAAIAALENAGTKECFVTERLMFELPFSAYNNFLRLVQQFDIVHPDSYFTDIVRVTVNVRISYKSELIKQFIELTAGQGQIEETN